MTPSSKELRHATALLAHHGEAKVHFLLAYAHQAAPETHYQPQTFGGIVDCHAHVFTHWIGACGHPTRDIT